ncbi:MAG TPA: alanine--tRNA ligase [Candidatus Saccharimonadales bacterium]|nr:alanine--tRNA ligase [Candidatus Saccharimonadales bacterium]
MKAEEIRAAYLKFVKDRQHVIIPRANLVPQDDPTTLFTGSGMQPMVPYLLGAPHPEGKRIADSQTCFRAEDIEEIGDNRHTTFFEMLGNWSLGDYFKKEQLPWFFEFLTVVVGLDPQKIYVTCYIGNERLEIPRDKESSEIWKRLFKEKGIDALEADLGSETDGAARGVKDGERIFYYDGKKNWWSRGGPEKTTPVGDPCGPTSEVFYLFEHIPHDPAYGEHCHPNCDCGRYVEVGNSVFMTYKRVNGGFAADSFEKLPAGNVDFGGGLERISQAAEGSGDMFRISLLWPIIQELEKLTGHMYLGNEASMRVIADHLRGAVFLVVDGVLPSNNEQGYVLRRLIRRAVRFAFDLNVDNGLLEKVVPVVVSLYEKDYPEVTSNKQQIIDALVKEEKLFRQTLQAGVRHFERELQGKTELDGETVFKLYDTYGFPTELSLEEAGRHKVKIAPNWQHDFMHAMDAQKERSRTAFKGQFKGGLEGRSDMHRKYHSATHLMYKALRLVLGDHVIQRGSNITEERLRFDFSHPEKVTPEEIAKIEEIVNEQIKKSLTVTWEELPTDEAFKRGAMGAFGDKYGEKVKVYTMKADGEEKPFSFEICGGPHVDNTSELAEGGKRFKILKEESSSAGVRRIKAALV